MSRFRRHRLREPGLMPGTVVVEGEEAGPMEPVRVHVLDYDAERLEDREVDDVSTCAAFRAADTVTWIDVDGVHAPLLVQELGALFGLHRLTLEDIVSTWQRPKMEEFAGYVFVVLQMMHYDHEGPTLRTEQVSLVIGEGFLLSFQEGVEGDVFEPVRRRLRESQGRIRSAGADYLAYALIDVVVDYYMHILEDLGEHIEAVEDAVMEDPQPEVMQRITLLRRHAITLRRSLWPLRDVVTALERSDLPFMAPETDIFFRDVHDHAVRTADLIEASRETLATLTDLYVSELSFRMNEVMKVLALISTIFLPLSFIAGVYGMNFDPAASPWNMPELGWAYGYPLALGLMLVVAVGMLVYFRTKRWL